MNARADLRAEATLARLQGVAPGGPSWLREAREAARGRVLVTSTDGQHAVELGDDVAAHVFVVVTPGGAVGTVG